MKAELIRPSALPKLQECRCYVGTSGTSEAAARGTRLDEAIRRLWTGDDTAWDLCEAPEEVVPVNWALNTMKLLACGADVETREEELQAIVPVASVKPGTMDALCVSMGWLADFKTGQVRDYKAQMAAYSLACMEAYFSDDWTAHLLFVDQKLVVSHHFTREEAEALVKSIVAAPKIATPCEYCGWCSAFETCPAVRGAASELTKPMLPALTPHAKSVGQLPPSLEELLNDHAAAHNFLTKLAIVTDWAELLKRKLRDQLTPQEGLEAPTSEYFKRVVVAGRKVVNPLSLAKYGMELGYDRMLKICSQIPLSKVEEVWKEVFGDRPVPEDIIVTSGGSVSLRLTKPKKNLPNNNN